MAGFIAWNLNPLKLFWASEGLTHLSWDGLPPERLVSHLTANQVLEYRTVRVPLILLISTNVIPACQTNSLSCKLYELSM